MIFHYAGKYSGDESTLPQREHPEGYVPFKEPQSMKKLAIIANAGAITLMIVLFIPLLIVARGEFIENPLGFMLGFALSLLTALPHELLHALCFKGDVYMYTNLSQGMLFVIGTEDMSRARFVFMSMLPNLVFGFVPYIAALLCPKLTVLGAMGLSCIAMGFGDYINVWNALTQVPRSAKVYLSGMHSYWYK